MKHPNPKAHLIISLTKSAVRTVGCVLALTASGPVLAVGLLASMFLVAEIIGVVEELV